MLSDLVVLVTPRYQQDVSTQSLVLRRKDDEYRIEQRTSTLSEQYELGQKMISRSQRAFRERKEQRLRELERSISKIESHNGVLEKENEQYKRHLSVLAKEREFHINHYLDGAALSRQPCIELSQETTLIAPMRVNEIPENNGGRFLNFESMLRLLQEQSEFCTNGVDCEQLARRMQEALRKQDIED